MTLIEALKTDKKFYRRSWLDKTPITFEDIYKLGKEAFVADDWEIESIPVPITREQFDSAWYKTKVQYAGLGFTWDDGSVYKMLIKELGL